jgi:hypothetical protein
MSLNNIIYHIPELTTFLGHELKAVGHENDPFDILE